MRVAFPWESRWVIVGSFAFLELLTLKVVQQCVRALYLQWSGSRQNVGRSSGGVSLEDSAHAGRVPSEPSSQWDVEACKCPEDPSASSTRNRRSKPSARRFLPDIPVEVPRSTPPTSLSAITINVVSLTVTNCITACILLLLEALRIVPYSAGWLLWHIHLVLFVATVYVVLPVSFAVVSISSSIRSEVPWYIVVVKNGFTLLGVLWFTVVLPFTMGHRVFSLGYMEVHPDHLLARIGLLGVITVSVLSGVGSVEFPFQCLISLNVSDDHISKLKEQYKGVTAAIRELNKQPDAPFTEYFSASHSVGTATATAQGKGTPILRGVPAPQLPGTQERLEGLRILQDDLKRELEECLGERRNAARSRTWTGKLNRLFGWCMVGVCLYRVITAAINASLRRVSLLDPVTIICRLLYKEDEIPTEIDIWIPYISFVLLGTIICITIRSLAQRVTFIFQWLQPVYTPDSLAIATSYAVALYTAAYALLLRNYLPVHDRLLTAAVIGVHLKLDVALQHLSDIIFTASACVSLFFFVLYHLYKKNALHHTIHVA